MICQYWFFNHGFKLQDTVWNGCHDLCLNISDIAIITVKNVDYRCIIHNISKSEAINLLKNMFLKIVGMYKRYCLNFQSTQDSFFFTCLFCYI